MDRVGAQVTTAGLIGLVGGDEAEGQQQRLDVSAEPLGDGGERGVAVVHAAVGLEQTADEGAVDGRIVRVEDGVRDVGLVALASMGTFGIGGMLGEAAGLPPQHEADGVEGDLGVALLRGDCGLQAEQRRGRG